MPVALLVSEKMSAQEGYGRTDGRTAGRKDGRTTTARQNNIPLPLAGDKKNVDRTQRKFLMSENLCVLSACFKKSYDALTFIVRAVRFSCDCCVFLTQEPIWLLVARAKNPTEHLRWSCVPYDLPATPAFFWRREHVSALTTGCDHRLSVMLSWILQ